MELSREEITKSFQRKKQVHICVLAFVGMTAMGLLIFKMAAEQGKTASLPISGWPAIATLFVLILVVAVVAVKNWSCPACKKSLGEKIDLKNCPHCHCKFE